MKVDNFYHLVNLYNWLSFQLLLQVAVAVHLKMYSNNILNTTILNLYKKVWKLIECITYQLNRAVQQLEYTQLKPDCHGW